MIRKDVAFKIRIEEELRREFIEICRSEDMTAAQVVRKFMREYIARNRHDAEIHLKKASMKKVKTEQEAVLDNTSGTT